MSKTKFSLRGGPIQIWTIQIWPMLALLALMMTACAAPDEVVESEREAVIELGEAASDPGERGPYDAVWQVALDLSAFEADGALLIRSLDGQDLGFRLGEHSDREANVWRGWVIAPDEPETRRGSFTFTTQGTRLAGRIQVDQHAYAIAGNDGDYWLSRIDQDQMPPPGPPQSYDDEGGED